MSLDEVPIRYQSIQHPFLLIELIKRIKKYVHNYIGDEALTSAFEAVTNSTLELNFLRV